MKVLHIIRHGKSSWDYPGIDDLDRPLIDRGIKNAFATGNFMVSNYGMPDKIISSPAIRALHTAIIIARAVDLPYSRLVVDDRIYETDSSTIIEVVEENEDSINSVAIVGHNPILTEFCNLFLPDYLENLPTSGMVTLEFDSKNWTIVDKQPVKTHVYFPRKE